MPLSAFLEAKANTLQTELNATSSKELFVFNDETLEAANKAKKLIEIRTSAEVQKDSLNKLKVQIYNAEDEAIRLGIATHYAIGSFRDSVRDNAVSKAKEAINELLNLAKGEDIHFVNRTHTVTAIDKVENLCWVGNNRANSLSNLRKLRGIFETYQAFA